MNGINFEKLHEFKVFREPTRSTRKESSAASDVYKRQTMAIPCVWALPCGLDHKKMPFGIQLIAPAGKDVQLSEIAKSLESVLMANKLTKRPVPEIK